MFPNKRLISFCFVAGAVISGLLGSPATMASVDQRSTFLKAEKHVWKPDSPEYQNLYQQLHYYPLQPYLDQKRLMDKIRLSDAKEIEEFLTEYRGTPLDWPLRKKWLNYLAKRERKALFLKFFKPNNDAKLSCTQLSYQLAGGMPEKVVLPQVKQWWLVGKSQDKACDPIFKQWKKAGYLTPDLVWQRLSLAADGGKHTLIPYLTGLLPKEEQYLGKLFHRVRRDPSYISKLSRFKTFNEKETQIMAYGLKRLIWRDPERALKTYQLAQQKFTFTEQQQDYLTKRFALALATKHHAQADTWLTKVKPDKLDSNLVQWKLATALKQQNWPDIQKTLLALPDRLQEKPQWQYWYARSMAEVGRDQAARELMLDLAKKRHYYGFMAAKWLSQNINLQHNPLLVDAKVIDNIIQNPAAKRAFELFHLERYSQARKEWNYWLATLSKSEKLAAASFAFEQGWFDRPIFTLASQGYLDDVELRFPMAYKDDIASYADKHSIDPSWAFAIARRESSFMRDAHSSAGARGLMQIMPATAKQLEKKAVSNRYLVNAKNNIKLGTKYLKRLLDRYEGNLVLATASYNAGPYRVKQWLEKGETLPADIWIETIPFKETREYVKSVLAYKQIYQHKLNSEGESPFTTVLGMKIGTTSLSQ